MLAAHLSWSCPERFCRPACLHRPALNIGELLVAGWHVRLLGAHSGVPLFWESAIRPAPFKQQFTGCSSPPSRTSTAAAQGGCSPAEGSIVSRAERGTCSVAVIELDDGKMMRMALSVFSENTTAELLRQLVPPRPLPRATVTEPREHISTDPQA
jgi:hypothetical protein